MYEGYERDYGKPKFVNGKVALYERMETPPIKWAIKDILKERGIGVLFGSSGSMKSYLAVDLACRMVNGMDFHGKPMEQGNVIYIAGEAADETQERIDAWCEYYGRNNRPLVCPWAIQIHKSDEMRQLVESIHEVGNVKLVIFDNLADCSVGVKLNEPDEVGEHIKPNVLSFIKEAKAAMLMLHHTGHDGRDERGARVLRDMADTSIKSEKQSNNFDLTWTMKKVRRMQAGEELHFHIKDISQSVGIDNVAIILSGKRKEWVDKETGEIVTEPAVIKKFRNATELLEHYIEENGGEVDAVEAQIALGWRKQGDKKPKQTYYEALSGSTRIDKGGWGSKTLKLIPEESESFGNCSLVAD